MSSMKTVKHITPLFLLSAVFSVTKVQAQDISEHMIGQPTQSDFGGVGLMQMPTARMGRSGEFTLFYYDNEEYRRMAFNMQLFLGLKRLFDITIFVHAIQLISRV